MKLTIRQGRVISEIESSETNLYELLKQYDYLDFPCGGNGTCGKCKIKFIDNAPEPQETEKILLSDQELKDNIRLACFCRICESSEIEIPVKLNGSIQKPRATDLEKWKINSLIQKRYLQNLKESKRQKSEFTATQIKQIEKFLSAEQESLFNSDFTVVFSGPDILRVEQGNTVAHNYALAIDLGTTTIAVSILNAATGKRICSSAFANPQRKYGADLISRVGALRSGTPLVNLKQIVVERINKELSVIIKNHDLNYKNIYQVIITGNTVMNHIIAEIDPVPVAQYPFEPVQYVFNTESNSGFGFQVNQKAVVEIFPNIGGFVGGDIVSGIIAENLQGLKEHTVLYLDIGTNCEVVLKSKNKLAAASSPAGPALEGAGIKFGMRAESGAIADIKRIDEKEFKLITVRNSDPVGICGSGLFHLVDFFFRNGEIDSSGKILGSDKIAQIPEAIGLTENIYLSQQDIREFQLAKAAIVSAWKLLCEYEQTDEHKIERVLVSGAFGNFIRPEVFINLGVLPDIDPKKIEFTGNSSLKGAELAIINRNILSGAKSIVKKIKFVELASLPDFQDIFVAGLSLGRNGV